MVPYANLAEEFLARTCPMVCQVSSEEVLIMGGRCNGKKNDVFLMNIESEKIDCAAMEVGPLKCWSDNNAIFSPEDGKIMALIYANDRKAHLSEYVKGGAAFTILESFAQ